MLPNDQYPGSMAQQGQQGRRQGADGADKPYAGQDYGAALNQYQTHSMLQQHPSYPATGGYGGGGAPFMWPNVMPSAQGDSNNFFGMGNMMGNSNNAMGYAGPPEMGMPSMPHAGMGMPAMGMPSQGHMGGYHEDIFQQQNMMLQQMLQQQQQQQQQQMGDYGTGSGGASGGPSLMSVMPQYYMQGGAQDPSAMLGLNDRKVGRQKKSKDKPKRPLSAYNLFFKDERAKMLAEPSIKDEGEEEDVEDEKEKAVVSSKEQDDKDDKATSEDANTQQPRKRKREPHGKVSFEKMAKIIGARWKHVDSERLEIYKKKAEEDMDRYKREMDAYLNKQRQGLEGSLLSQVADDSQTKKEEKDRDDKPSNNEANLPTADGE